MLGRLLYLQPGEFRRLLPFFALYLVLFAAFSLADGLALTLFVERVGPRHLPSAYAFVAISNLVLMAGYLHLAERLGSVRTFYAVLGLCMGIFSSAWLAITFLDGGALWYGVLFAGREIGFTLFIMHFGTFLNDFFTRLELNRVLPIIYSGGRVGGILGGFLLERLAAPVGLLNLVGIFALMLAVAVAGLTFIAWRWPHVPHDDEDVGDPGVKAPRLGQDTNLETAARTSYAGFLRFVWASPLLFWTTVSTMLFVVCRWVLNFEYSSFFAQHFTDANALAEFLGRYTQLALLGSLMVQLLLVNRLVAWIGLRGTLLIYSGLVTLGMALNLGNMTFALAVFSRIVETELRFGLRNPIMQLITNKFAKLLRVRVRVWSLGTIIPLATLVASGMLAALVESGLVSYVPYLGGALGIAYFLASVGLASSFSEKQQARVTSSDA